MKSKNFDWIIPALLLLTATVLFRIYDLDMIIQSNYYDSEQGWFLKDVFPWNFLYHYGNMPALIISLGSLILLGISYFQDSLLKFRKVFFYSILIMAIGPGLLINSILKDNWGRPRPRNIIEFEGHYQYEKPLEFNSASSGKSFPCGHASMGFYLMAVYFILRRKRKKSAMGFLIVGIVYGGLIGFARIVQGGHFASDVIWAGGLVYLVSAGFYYLLKLDQEIYFRPKRKPVSKQKIVIIFMIGLAVIALLLLLLSATPYSYQKKFRIEDIQEYASIIIEVRRADLEFAESDKNEIILDAAGHGFPWSKLKTRLKQNDDVLSLKQRESGYFSEIVQRITFHVSDDLKPKIWVKIKDGNIVIEKNLEIDLEANLENGKIFGNDF